MIFVAFGNDSFILVIIFIDKILLRQKVARPKPPVP